MEPIIDLDQRYSPSIYTYDRAAGYKALVLQGLSPQLKGQFQIMLDSAASKHQTVVLAQGVEWEIVLELRPRRLTQIERIKLEKLL